MDWAASAPPPEPAGAVSALAERWRALPRGARVAALAIGSRLWIWAWMVAGTYFARPEPGYWAGKAGSLSFQNVPIRWMDVFGRWDTGFYLGIAKGGYPRLVSGWDYAAAYFPLFPSLMRGLATLLPGLPLFYAGVLVANAMFAGAVVYLDKLLRLDRSPALAELTVALLLAYPGSHFLSCVYPESTTLFLGVFALYCARTRRPVVAALACALAVLARSSGWVICVPVLYELCLRDDGRLAVRARALWLVLPVLALGLFLLLNLDLYKDPLYFIHVQAGWNRKPTLPFLPLLKFDLPIHYHLFTLGAAALVFLGLRQKERPGYVAMAGINVLLPLSTGLLRGIHRYMASNFPLFFFLGRGVQPRRGWRALYFAAGLLVLGIFSFKWGQGYHPN